MAWSVESEIVFRFEADCCRQIGMFPILKPIMKVVTPKVAAAWFGADEEIAKVGPQILPLVPDVC